MAYVKVWCEWDINGQFASGNEEVFKVPDNIVEVDLVNQLLNRLLAATGLEEEDLVENDTWGWEYVSIKELE